MTGQGTIVATGSIAYPAEWAHAPPDRLRTLGVSKVMTMSSTYDHRIIQGAESGSFLRRIEQLLARRGRLLRGRRPRARDRGQRRHERPPCLRLGPAAGRRLGHDGPGDLGRRTPDEELLQAVQAATSLLKAYRTHGHLSATLNPLGGDGKGDPGARAREPQPDPGADGPDPGLDPADRRPRRDAARRAAADARRLLRDDRLPDRAPLLPPAARLAARDDRDRHPPQAARQRGEAEPPAPADRGLPVRALPPEGLPRPEGVLDRGPRRDRPDDRRAGDAGPQGAAASRS